MLLAFDGMSATLGEREAPAYARSPRRVRRHRAVAGGRRSGHRDQLRGRGERVRARDAQGRPARSALTISAERVAPDLGWLTGLEPATSRITTWCSTN